MTVELQNTKKYEMIADRIEQMIVDSGMKPGDRILSIQKLNRHFGAAPATVCNALELLRERGIIVSIPQKGTFVHRVPEREQARQEGMHEEDIVDYLENALPLEPFFLPARKVISFKLKEYTSTPRQKMWDDIIQAFKGHHPEIEVEVGTDIEDRTGCDVVMYTDNLPMKELTDTPELRSLLDAGTLPEDYFPIARASLSGNRRPAKPFAVSQAWRICNRKMMEKHCPGLTEKDYSHLIASVSERFDYSSADFPAMGTFVQFLPLTLTEEGAAWKNRGKPDFDSSGVREVLEFNRCMIEKIRRYHRHTNELSIYLLWMDFMKNRLMALDSFSYILRLLAESRRDDFVIRPSPASGGGTAVTRVQMLGVMPDSPNAEAAAEFVRFACGPEGQRILAESQCNIPALRSCAESGAFLSGAPEGVGPDLLKPLYNARSLLNEPPFSNDRYFTLVNAVLSSYYYGKIDTENAVRKLNHIRITQDI